MEVIKNYLDDGKIVKIFCRNGTERKIYHQWANKNGYSSIPRNSIKFDKVFLYMCPRCNKRKYIERCLTSYENFPNFLDKNCWRTTYDDYNGWIYSCAIYCDECYHDDDFFLMSDDYENLKKINVKSLKKYNKKIMFESANCVLICKYDSVNSKLQNHIRKYKKSRENCNPYVDSFLENLSSLDSTRKFIVEF